MIRAAIAFFILAIVAFLFGASGIAGMSMEIAKILLFVFLALGVLTFFGSVLSGKRSKRIP